MKLYLNTITSTVGTGEGWTKAGSVSTTSSETSGSTISGQGSAVSASVVDSFARFSVVEVT